MQHTKLISINSWAITICLEKKTPFDEILTTCIMQQQGAVHATLTVTVVFQHDYDVLKGIVLAG